MALMSTEALTMNVYGALGVIRQYFDDVFRRTFSSSMSGCLQGGVLGFLECPRREWSPITWPRQTDGSTTELRRFYTGAKVSVVRFGPTLFQSRVEVQA